MVQTRPRFICNLLKKIEKKEPNFERKIVFEENKSSSKKINRFRRKKGGRHENNKIDSLLSDSVRLDSRTPYLICSYFNIDSHATPILATHPTVCLSMPKNVVEKYLILMPAPMKIIGNAFSALDVASIILRGSSPASLSNYVVVSFFNAVSKRNCGHQQ